jgi:splicing factor U2AF subunit
MLLQNMYQNPVINAPLGPDGFPIKVDERKQQQEFEVSSWPAGCGFSKQ